MDSSGSGPLHLPGETGPEQERVTSIVMIPGAWMGERHYIAFVDAFREYDGDTGCPQERP
jgi:hypothetical protein